MDAVHLARALTGRDLIIKVEGCYHGHHDSVQVSVLPEADEVGPRDHPNGVPGKHRYPRGDPRSRDRGAVQRPGAVARALAEHRGQVAAMILEPVMMNAGIIPPDDGYLAAIRDLVHGDGRAADLRRGEDRLHHRTRRRHRAVSGVVPDMVCLAKALGGGIAVAAIGGTDDGDVGDRRRPLRAGRHVQRQSAGDGGHPRHPDRGAHPAGLRPPRRAGAPAARRRWRPSSPSTASTGTS